MQRWVIPVFVGNAMLIAAQTYEAKDYSLHGLARFLVAVGIVGTGAFLTFMGRPPGTSKATSGTDVQP
jgi:hypothetical protein